MVFAPRVGQAKRLTALFGHLPEVVIPRASILTVCANRADPMRRARQIKDDVLTSHGLWLLCGTWLEDRREAERPGYDLSGGAWAAVRPYPLGSIRPFPNDASACGRRARLIADLLALAGSLWHICPVRQTRAADE